MITTLRIGGMSAERKSFLEQQATALRHEAMLGEQEVARLEQEVERLRRTAAAVKRKSTEKRLTANEIEARIARLTGAPAR
jgi:hypothetical protein